MADDDAAHTQMEAEEPMATSPAAHASPAAAAEAPSARRPQRRPRPAPPRQPTDDERLADHRRAQTEQEITSLASQIDDLSLGSFPRPDDPNPRRVLEALLRRWQPPADAVDFVPWANERFGFDLRRPITPKVLMEAMRLRVKEIYDLYMRYRTKHLCEDPTTPPAPTPAEEQARNMDAARAGGWPRHDVNLGRAAPAPTELSLNHLFGRIFEAIHYAYFAVEGHRRVVHATDPNERGEPETPPGLAMFKFAFVNSELQNPFQNVILYLLRGLHERGYRRYRGDCYAELEIPQRPGDGPDGPRYRTQAWRKVATIDEFVHRAIKKETIWGMWLQLTASRGNARDAIQWLKTTEDIEFMELEPSRHVFSFRNGIYDCQNCVFCPYDSPELDHTLVAAKYHDVDFPLEIYSRFVSGAARVADAPPVAAYSEAPSPPTVAAAAPRLVDIVRAKAGARAGGAAEPPVTLRTLTGGGGGAFDFYHDIPTPYFQGILDAQQMPEGACRMAYVCLGRLFYEVGALDDWQLIPFWKGVAQSGKSTTLKVARSFYDEQDIGLLSSNCEEKFALGPIADKFLWLCFEVKRKFTLSQADLQSMISGEAMSIARKYQNAESRTWTVPGMAAGNETGGWVDTQGSMCRRLLVFEFRHAVTNTDEHLIQRIRTEEMGRLIFKCNLAYRQTVGELTNHPRTNIWAILPSYFRDTRERLRSEINPLACYLRLSGEITRAGPQDKAPRYILWDEFRRLFKTWLEKNSYPRTPLQADSYVGVFSDFKIEVELSKEGKEWRGVRKPGQYLLGAYLTEDAGDVAPPSRVNAPEH